MAVQSTYNNNMTAGAKGMIANMTDCDIISKNVETAALGFGVVVKQGAADDGVVAATAASDVYRGITVRDQSVRPGSADSIPVGDTAALLVRGVIWVLAGAVCTVGTAAYMIVGTGQAGNFSSTPTSNLAIPRGTFESSGVLGDLVKLRLS